MNRTKGSPRTTRELIEQVLAADPPAKEALVEKYRDPLDHYIRLRVGAHLRQKVDVDDVFQETFAKALVSLAEFRWLGDDSFLKWLKSIAEHVILALAKKSRREQVLFVEPRHPRVESVVPSPSVAARRDERFERLQAALESLSPDHREVIVLARLKRLRLSEVGKRLNRTPNAVAHLLSRALEKLKEAFGDTESLGLPPRRLAGLDGEGDSHDDLR